MKKGQKAVVGQGGTHFGQAVEVVDVGKDATGEDVCIVKMTDVTSGATIHAGFPPSELMTKREADQVYALAEAENRPPEAVRAEMQRGDL